MNHIAILGELIADRKPRNSIVPALKSAAKHLGVSVQTTWMTNDEIDLESLNQYDGIFIAPGSPMEDTGKILEAIRYAREKGIPVLGTCGGFQRIVTEFAVNVLQMDTIAHQEKDPDAEDPLFSMLACSIASKEAEIEIKENTRVHGIYDTLTSAENFYCSYGLNNLYAEQIEKAGLTISASDCNGSARVVEISDHPFFFGTLFVPQVDSTEENPHPMIRAFVRAVCTRERTWHHEQTLHSDSRTHRFRLFCN